MTGVGHAGGSSNVPTYTVQLSSQRIKDEDKKIEERFYKKAE